MKRIKRTWVAAALAVAAVGAVAVPLMASAETHHAKLPIADARAKALQVVPGKIQKEELEKEEGRWIYTFDIKPSDEKRNLVKEVNLDADTGAVVSVDTEEGEESEEAED